MTAEPTRFMGKILDDSVDLTKNCAATRYS